MSLISGRHTVWNCDALCSVVTGVPLWTADCITEYCTHRRLPRALLPQTQTRNSAIANRSRSASYTRQAHNSISFNTLARSLGLIFYELPCNVRYLQKAQLSQRDRATLRMVTNFGTQQPTLCKISPLNRAYSGSLHCRGNCLYLLELLRYSTSNNGVRRDFPGSYDACGRVWRGFRLLQHWEEDPRSKTNLFDIIT